jgi:hypothetical protein
MATKRGVLTQAEQVISPSELVILLSALDAVALALTLE